MRVELSEQEREYLAALLLDRLGELRQEVHHTDISHYKDQLKEQELLLRQLIEKFGMVHTTQE